MPSKSKHIPVNTLPAGTREGIIIARTSFNGLPGTKEVERPHRDNGHVFILQEKGKAYLEIDFQKHCLSAPALIYIHTDQIHRVMGFEDATMTSWIITSENLNQENLDLLQELSPVKVLELTPDTFSILSQTASLCLNLVERKQQKCYNTLLKQSINLLTSLVTSQYLALSKNTDQNSRFDTVSRSFKSALERYFKTVKSPSAYADKLSISTAYLNECVKTATGSPVSHHIHQRVVLEAKRMLFHSALSVKEIAAELGYDDFSYFTRLFVKITGMTPVTFKSKNLE